MPDLFEILFSVVVVAWILKRLRKMKKPASETRKRKKNAADRRRGDQRNRSLEGLTPWREAAASLGLEFVEPLDSGEQIIIRGQFGGLAVEARTLTRKVEGRDKVYSKFRIEYGCDLGLGLSLTRQGRAAALGKTLGQQDIELGDFEFDAAVVVKSDDEDAVREFLTPARRIRAQKLLMLYKGSVISDSSINWIHRGFLHDARVISKVIRRMVHVARHFISDRENDRLVNRSIDARRRGRIDEAVEMIREMVVPVGDEQAIQEKKEFEAGALSAARRYEEARVVLEEPDRPDFDGPAVAVSATRETRESVTESWSFESRSESHGEESWSLESGSESHETESLEPALEFTASKTGPPPLPTTPRWQGAPEREELIPEAPPENESLGAEELCPVESPAVDGTPIERGAKADLPVSDIDSKAFCEELFHPDLLSLESTRLFEQKYVGKRVRWTGKLSKVESYPFDFLFGDSPGTKAFVELHSVDSPFRGSSEIVAVVQLSVGDEESIQDRIGEELSFEATLHSVDGFVRLLYLEQGQLTKECVL